MHRSAFLALVHQLGSRAGMLGCVGSRGTLPQMEDPGQHTTTHNKSEQRADRARASCGVSARAAGANATPWAPDARGGGLHLWAGDGNTKSDVAFCQRAKQLTSFSFSLGMCSLISLIDSFFRTHSALECAVK